MESFYVWFQLLYSQVSIYFSCFGEFCNTEAVNLQEGFVDYDTSPDFLSTWEY